MDRSSDCAGHKWCNRGRQGGTWTPALGSIGNPDPSRGFGDDAGDRYADDRDGGDLPRRWLVSTIGLAVLLSSGLAPANRVAGALSPITVGAKVEETAPPVAGAAEPLSENNVASDRHGTVYCGECSENYVFI